MNQINHFIHFIIIAIFISLISCEVEEDNDILTLPTSITPNDGRIANAISKQTILTNLSVQTVNSENTSLANTVIKINDEYYTTNTDGYILIEDVVLNEDYTLITATKTGYEKVMKTITPSKNGITSIKLTLLNDIAEQTFSATTGGVMTFGEVTVDFPTNAIIDANNEPYSGTVTMNLVYHDPSADNFLSSQPGTLVGLTDEDDLTALISEGMITVNLTDDTGKKLNLADNKSASITMPATADSPAEIDLWHLNETYGIWVEVGKAIKNGDKYEFTVDHFSSYNLDWKVNPIGNITITVLGTNNAVLANKEVTLYIDNLKTMNVSTDNMGQFELRNAPKGEYSLEATSSCASNTSSSENISTSGQYTLNFNQNIQVERLIHYTGKLYYCDNELATNKAFNIKYLDATQDKYLYGYTNSTGEFTISKIICNTQSGIYNAEISILENNEVITQKFDIDMTYDSLDFDINACGYIAALNENTIINIPDEKLRNVILDSLGFTANTTIKYKDALTITQIGELSISYSIHGVNTLEGLQYFKNLEVLGVFAGNITSLFPLKDLYKLKTVNVSYQKINDITPILNHTQIEELFIGGTNTSDAISLLKHFTLLKKLELTWSEISVIPKEIENFKDLNVLILNNNNISNLSPLITLKNLYHLELEHNNISDLTPLEEMDFSYSNQPTINLKDNPLTQAQIDTLKIKQPNLKISF